MPDPSSREWRAMAREGQLAAEQMALGVTALHKARFDRVGLYYQAFFGLSIGLERAAKLALASANVVSPEPRFKPREFSHDLGRLLTHLEAFAQSEGMNDALARLPTGVAERGALAVLSDFASNVTRYYNIDLLENPASTRPDPVAAWKKQVILPILNERYKKHHKERHVRQAIQLHEAVGPALVSFETEDGQPIDDVLGATLVVKSTEFARPHARLAALRLCRFVSYVISEFGTRNFPEVPYYSEIFGLFIQEDEVFLKKRTWTMYPA